MFLETQENIYLQRINHVIDYITTHLTDDLSLNTLANVAGFSDFHFHRIFKSITDETTNQFVARVRVEHATALLRVSPSMSILDAALACGYQSAEGFARVFKKHFGINPSQWDRYQPLQDSKIGQMFYSMPRYTIETLRTFENTDGFTVQVRSLPAQRLAYIRVMDSYSDFRKIVEAYERLMRWYLGWGGRLADAAVYGMSQDNPDVTPIEKCRFDWCVAVPDHWQVEGDIAVREFPACYIAVVHIEGDVFMEDRALQYLWNYWLPRSRYQPADLPGMEIYHEHPYEIGWEHFNIDCAIPVIDL